MIEDKLLQMKKMANYVKNNEPVPAESKLINQTFQKLKKDVEEIDEYSKKEFNDYQSESSRTVKRLEKKLKG
jgi:type II secretory pathway component PulC